MADFFSGISRANANNEKVLAALPADPPRGSYYWWARLARQNTGQSLGDSGAAYGYQYERGVAPHTEYPVTISLPNGDFDGISIGLVQHLMSFTDATDDVAVALEDVFNWYAKYLAPDDNWLQAIYGFCANFQKIVGFDKSSDEFNAWAADAPLKFDYAAIKAILDGDYPEDSEINHAEDAIADAPLSQIRELLNADIRWPTEEDRLPVEYTYNNENDLDQDYQYAILEGEDGSYAFIQTHNGCDARGGMSHPVCAALTDIYPDSPRAELWCGHCDHDFDSPYYYKEALRKFHGVYHEYDKGPRPKPVLITEEDVQMWRDNLEEKEQLDAGQSMLPGFPAWEWPKNWESPDIITLLVKHYYNVRDETEADFEGADYPDVLLVAADGVVSIPYPHDNPVNDISSNSALLLCPNCGKYAVKVQANVWTAGYYHGRET